MCGIVGFVSRLQGDESASIKRMTETLRHRGPDEQNTWLDQTKTVALGHTRLSILDLSPLGRQPMHSASGRYVITFNGEIYNFAAIREELLSLGHIFQGRSDTEIMLAAFEEWGREAVKKFNGMFAFAVWDERDQMLHLARDRIGEKPLYYGWIPTGGFLFGSELKALRAYPAFAPTIRRESLILLLRYGYILAPHTIYEEIWKLQPGTILSLSREELERRPSTFSPFAEQPNCAPQSYWSLREVALAGRSNQLQGSDSELLSQLHSLLSASVKLRMVADVPVGAFLSGGVDSSLTVALMQQLSSAKVKTFSIGFQEKEFNEAPFAAEIARHLGTDHTEMILGERECLEIVPHLPTMYDEPFGDSSQIATHLVSRLAKSQVTVSLSGDGGDEIFGGYPRYLWGERIRFWTEGIAPALRTLSLAGVKVIPENVWSKAALIMRPFWSANQCQRFGHRLHRFAEACEYRSRSMLFSDLMGHWSTHSHVVPNAIEPRSILNSPATDSLFSNYYHQMMFMDQGGYLPDDILVKVDRAAMAVSLETRIPLLAPEIIEFSWRLPFRFHFRGGVAKWALKQLLAQHVPTRLTDRPKTGFGVPLTKWLRGPLRPWAEDLLSEARLNRQGYLNTPLIRKRWVELRDHGQSWDYSIWHVLMFQAWLEGT